MTEPTEYVRNPTRARLDEQQEIVEAIIRAHYAAMRLVCRCTGFPRLSRYRPEAQQS